ncbi:MAG: ExbD/TolR family protein [Phycisphaerales bacterium]
MRLRRLNHGSSFTEAINVTPLIDVVMCLIIFFLIVSRMAADQLAGVKLPDTKLGASSDTSEALVINIAQPTGLTVTSWGGAAARVAVGARVVSTERELEDVLRERASEVAIRIAGPGRSPVISAVPVRIRADRDLPYGAVQPALRTCQRLGLVAVRLVTERSEEQ